VSSGFFGVSKEDVALTTMSVFLFRAQGESGFSSGFSVDKNRIKRNIRVNPALRLGTSKKKSELPTRVGTESRTHQSEEKVEVGVGLHNKNDDIDDLCGRRGIRVSVPRLRLLAHAMTFPLTQTTAPTEQVSMTVRIKRSIT